MIITTSTNKTKTPSTAAIVAERDADHKRITDIQTTLQADATDRKARWEAYLVNPLSLDRAAAMSLYHEHQALDPMAAAFSPQMLEFQLRAFDERFFREEKDVCLTAFNSELDAALVPQPSYVAKLTKWLSELPSRIYAPTVTAEEREKLLAERDKKEDAAEALASAIVNARAAISRFSATPSPEFFGGVQSAISFVKSALA